MSVERLEDRLAPAAGALDQTFGTGGKVTIAFTDASGFPSVGGADAVVLQTDGKILAVGDGHSTGEIDFVLARYLANGTLDTSFGINGTVITDFGDRDTAHSVALQADGKIVVAGQTGLFTSNFALARFNSDGSPDLSFGTGGKVTTDFANGFDIGFKVVIKADGEIVVAGQAQTDFGLDFAVARYNSDGTLDTSFGTGGKVTTDFGGPHDNAGGDADAAPDMVIQADGKIVAAGTAHVTGPDNDDLDFTLVRYNADGSLDTSFGTGGTVITDFAGDSDLARSVALQPDGKIVVAGFTLGTDFQHFALARYEGVAPEIAVSVATTGLASGSTVAYGSTLQGTPVTKTFIIRNFGNLSLTVSSFTVPAGY